MLIPSNLHRVRVGHPKSEAADRRAQDFFSYESGAALYLGGSHSTFLNKGMNTLLSMIDEQSDTLAAAKTAARIARGVGRPFHDIEVKEGAPEASAAYAAATGDTESFGPRATIRRTTEGSTADALRLTDLALRTFRRHTGPNSMMNIPLERLVRTRADVLIRMGDPEQAQDEMRSLAAELEESGVKRSVVDQIGTDAASIETTGTRRHARPAVHKIKISASPARIAEKLRTSASKSAARRKPTRRK